MAVQRACRVCKAVFTTKPYYLKKGQGLYCSMPCRHAFERKGKMVRCEQCGEEVYRKPRSLKLSKSQTYFCSKACQTVWRNAQFIGEKHSNWRGGMYAYRSVLTRHKIKQVCRLCKTTDTRVLAVHHIDQNRKNNAVDNLAWLCHNCHHLVHHHEGVRREFMATIV